MARASGWHIDNRRLLAPRDYLENPYRFGETGYSRLITPPGGDDVSRRIAEMQHRLVAIWNSNGRRPSVADICTRYGFSKQLFSQVARGERWAGETALSALVTAAMEGSSNRATQETDK